MASLTTPSLLPKGRTKTDAELLAFNLTAKDIQRLYQLTTSSHNLLMTNNDKHIFHTEIDSSSTSESEDDDEEWVSPISKNKHFQNAEQMDSSIKTLSSTPPPLPKRRDITTNENVFTPPPTVPYRRRSSVRKFALNKNRRESLSGMEIKYKRKEKNQQDEEEEEKEKNTSTSTNAISTASPNTVVDVAKATSNHAYVKNVCAEIIKTEKSYCAFMDSAVNHFLIPLRQQINLGHMEIDAVQGNRDVAIIFSNIESIRSANQVLLERLLNTTADNEDENNTDKKQAGTTTTVHRVASAFQYIVQYFRLYSVYCGNYQKSLRRLSELRRIHPMLDRFVDKCSQTSGTGLQTLLIKPIQRICKYPLFFRDLLRHVSATDKDRALLEGKVSEICSKEMSMF